MWSFFHSNTSGVDALLDALLDMKDVHVIETTHEGQGVSVAGGFRLTSGQTPLHGVRRLILANTITDLYNPWELPPTDHCIHPTMRILADPPPVPEFPKSIDISSDANRINAERGSRPSERLRETTVDKMHCRLVGYLNAGRFHSHFGAALTSVVWRARRCCVAVSFLGDF